jgi:hypothetical protein
MFSGLPPKANRAGCHAPQTTVRSHADENRWRTLLPAAVLEIERGRPTKANNLSNAKWPKLLFKSQRRSSLWGSIKPPRKFLVLLIGRLGRAVRQQE